MVLASAAELSASPLISVGDSVNIFFNGRAALRYQSNVFNRPAANDDFSFILGPGVEVDIGNDSPVFNMNIRYREDFYFYTKYTDLNNSRANVFLNASYNRGPLSTNGGFSFVQTQQNTAQNTLGLAALNTNLVQRDLYNAFIKNQYNFSEKYWMRLGFSWNRVEYTNNSTFGFAYQDRDYYSVPVDFSYRVTPKWSIGPGFRYRYTDLYANPANNARYYSDWFANLAVTGEIFPKLTTNVNIGYQVRDGSNVSDDGRFTVLASFFYNLSEKTELFLDVTKDFDSGGTGSSVDSIDVGVGARYNINSYLYTVAEFEYGLDDYQNFAGNPQAGREDNLYTFSVSLGWTPPAYTFLSASIGYSYFKNDSNTPGISYDNNAVTLQVNVRY